MSSSPTGPWQAPFHERIHQWLPGIEEVTSTRMAAAKVGPVRRSEGASCRRAARGGHTARDREEEVAGFARWVRAVSRAGDAPMLDRMALVVRQRLPYVYLATDVFRSAGVPSQMFDALPLAAEPYAAALDVLFSFVSANFARVPAIALLRSPHFTCAGGDGEPIRAGEVAALDRALSESGYLGDLEALDRLIESWQGEGSRVPAAARRAGVALREIARELAPLRSSAAIAAHLDRLLAFLAAHDPPAQPAVAGRLGEASTAARAPASRARRHPRAAARFATRTGASTEPSPSSTRLPRWSGAASKRRRLLRAAASRVSTCSMPKARGLASSTTYSWQASWTANGRSARGATSSIRRRSCASLGGPPTPTASTAPAPRLWISCAFPQDSSSSPRSRSSTTRSSGRRRSSTRSGLRHGFRLCAPRFGGQVGGQAGPPFGSPAHLRIRSAWSRSRQHDLAHRRRARLGAATAGDAGRRPGPPRANGRPRGEGLLGQRARAVPGLSVQVLRLRRAAARRAAGGRAGALATRARAIHPRGVSALLRAMGSPRRRDDHLRPDG